MKMLKRICAAVIAACCILPALAGGDTLGGWATDVKNGKWQTGKLSSIATAYQERIKADPADYEARILHAATILAQLGENKNVTAYAKQFGFTLNYLKMEITGSATPPSGWPAVNTLVDTFVKEAVPVLKEALGDLSVIPEDWDESVVLSADEYPVDEDTAIDIGDVLYARAGIEAAIGTAYFAQGYDLTTDYAKVKAAFDYERTVPVVKRAPSMTTDEGWDGALSNDRTKVLLNGNKLFIRVLPDVFEEDAVVDYMFLDMFNFKKSDAEYALSITRDYLAEDGGYTAVLGKSDDVKAYSWYGNETAYRKLAKPAVAWNVDEEGCLTLSVDISSRKELAAAGTLAFYWGEVGIWQYEYYDTDAFDFDSSAATLYKLFTEQTKFLSKVRNQASLTMSKDWIRDALTDALAADEFVQNRDDGEMHLVEYDPIDEDVLEQARNLTAKALVALDEPTELDVNEDILNGRDAPFDVTLLPNDGIMQIYLGALFEGKITRDLLPAFNKGADEGPVPVIETIKDPTLAGLLPELTSQDWMELVKDMGYEVAHQDVTVKLAPQGGKLKQTSLALVFDEETEWYVYPGLPEPEERKGYEFAGWATKADGINETLDLEGMPWDASIFEGAKQPTLYAQWLKESKITVAGGLLEDDATTKGELWLGDEVAVTVDPSKELDKNEQLVNAFANWTYTPATADLGADFDPFARDVTVTMPNGDVKLTANFVNGFAAYLSMTAVLRGADDMDVDEEELEFYWSVDNGKTLIPCREEYKYPVKAGTVTVKFYDKTGIWRVPADLKLTVAKRGTYKDGSVTYYEAPEEISEEVTFMPIATSAQVKFDANGGKASVASMWCVEGEEFGALPEVAERKGYEFAGWWTEKTGGTLVEAETPYSPEDFAGQKTPTLYAQWLKYSQITVSGGSLSDGAKFKNGLLAGDTVEGIVADLEANELDKNGQQVNAFANWTYTPATEDLGEGFNPLSPTVAVTMPNGDVKLTANYVKGFAAYISMTANLRGEAEEEGDFYWSVDGGKTLIPFGDENLYPVKAGAVVVKFYDMTGIWRAPADLKLTVAKRGSHKDGSVIVYDEPEVISEEVTFMPMATSAQVKFDANGGKASTSALWCVAGDAYGDLPEVAQRKGYVFAGWWTDKTDGELITADAEFDADIFAGQKTPTVYAHWLKLVKLTMVDATATASWVLTSEDEDEQAFYDEVIMPQLAGEDEDPITTLEGKGTLEVVPGALVTVSVPESTEVKDKELMFQKWTVTPSKTYLGDEFRVTASDATFVMSSEDVKLQATYADPETVCCGLYAAAIVNSISLDYEDTEHIIPPYGAFEWSPDGGKTWYKATGYDGNGFADDYEGEVALLKAGTYTVTWRSNDPHWIAPTTKTKVVLKSDDDEAPAQAVFSQNEFTFAPEVVIDVLTYSADEGTWVASDVGGTVTLNPADGLLLPGKSVSITAKAAKGYAFQGYGLGTEWDFWTSEATWKLENFPYLNYYLDPVDEKLHAVALFKAIEDYSASDIMFGGFATYYGMYMVSDDVVDINAVVGCEVDYSLSSSFMAFPLSYKLEGKLPDGLKLDTKTGVLYGTPTKKGAATFKVVATDPAKNSKSLTVNIEVKAQPSWLAGEYRAISGAGEGIGLVEMSVKADGKVSAKIIAQTGTYSVAGTLGWQDPVLAGEEEGDGTFVFNDEAKDGTWMNVGFNPDGSVYGEAEWYDKAASEWTIVMIGGLRQDKDLFAKSKFRDKYYTFAFSAGEDESEMDSGYGYLTLKTDKAGTAKVTGQLPDGEKLSMSALVLPFAEDPEEADEDTISAKLFLFASPAAYKKAGYFSATLTLNPDGSVTVDEDAVAVWAPGSSVAVWCCGMQQPPEINGFGFLYSEAKSLENYYWTASCASSEKVMQQYSYKFMEYDEDEKLVTTTAYDYATAIDFDGMFFNVNLSGSKSGTISLTEKSPAPWEQTFKEDGVTWKEWNYDTDKNDNDITDPSQLSISFTKATGIFTGKATVYFDYELPSYKKNSKTGEIEESFTKQHKTATLPYTGVMICSGADEEVSYAGFGSALYTFKYADEETGKQQTRVVSLPVSLE